MRKDLRDKRTNGRHAIDPQMGRKVTLRGAKERRILDSFDFLVAFSAALRLLLATYYLYLVIVVQEHVYVSHRALEERTYVRS